VGEVPGELDEIRRAEESDHDSPVGDNAKAGCACRKVEQTQVCCYSLERSSADGLLPSP